MFSISPKNSSNNDLKYKNKGIIAGGLMASSFLASSSTATQAINKYMKQISTPMKDEYKELNRAARKGLKISGLYQKGVKIHKIQQITSPNKHKTLTFAKKDEKAISAIVYEAANNKVIKLISKFDKTQGKNITENWVTGFTESWYKTVKLGLTAGYLPNANKIILPSKSHQTAVFHEMGHALNNNNEMFLKYLQKCRLMTSVLPVFILLTALLNKRKTTDSTNKHDSKIQKSADFIKRNAGKLTAFSIAPKILEESIASIKGEGIAKKLVNEGILSKEMFKKVKLANLCGFSTYLLSFCATIIAFKLAIYVKDKIQEQYEERQTIKYILKDEEIANILKKYNT